MAKVEIISCPGDEAKDIWASMPDTLNMVRMGHGRYTLVPCKPPCYISADLFIGASEVFNKKAVDAHVEFPGNYDTLRAELANKCARLTAEELAIITIVLMNHKYISPARWNSEAIHVTNLVTFSCEMKFSEASIRDIISLAMDRPNHTLCEAWSAMVIPDGYDYVCDHIVKIIKRIDNRLVRNRVIESIKHEGLLRALVRVAYLN